MNQNDLSTKYILSEVAKIQYLYQLKYEIRYAQNRHETDTTESVAEHIYGMHILCQYFLPLENPESTWDKARIYEMITLHDIDEIETGDVIGYQKSAEMLAAEGNVMRQVMQKSPISMQRHMTVLIDEYEQQTTAEAKFVKALDRFEPIIHLFNDNGKKIQHAGNTTYQDFAGLREEKLRPYPVMYKYYQVVAKEMLAAGHFNS